MSRTSQKATDPTIPKRKRYWVVMSLAGWDCFRVSTLGGEFKETQPRDDPKQPCAFLPVFTTKRAAARWARGDPVAQIERQS